MKFIHHGETGADPGCKSVSTSTVDPEKSTNISCKNLIHVLERQG